jgi:hypothetical protein
MRDLENVFNFIRVFKNYVRSSNLTALTMLQTWPYDPDDLEPLLVPKPKANPEYLGWTHSEGKNKFSFSVQHCNKKIF